MAINRTLQVPLQHPTTTEGWVGWVFAKLIHGARKEWITRHSQWKVLPHDDASSTGTQPAHHRGAVGAPDAYDLLPLLSECVSHRSAETPLVGRVLA